jgi:hypothetical protein
MRTAHVSLTTGRKAPVACNNARDDEHRVPLHQCTLVEIVRRSHHGRDLCMACCDEVLASGVALEVSRV